MRKLATDRLLRRCVVGVALPVVIAAPFLLNGRSNSSTPTPPAAGPEHFVPVQPISFATAETPAASASDTSIYHIGVKVPSATGSTDTRWINVGVYGADPLDPHQAFWRPLLSLRTRQSEDPRSTGLPSVIQRVESDDVDGYIVTFKADRFLQEDQIPVLKQALFDRMKDLASYHFASSDEIKLKPWPITGGDVDLTDHRCRILGQAALLPDSLDNVSDEHQVTLEIQMHLSKSAYERMLDEVRSGCGIRFSWHLHYSGSVPHSIHHEMHASQKGADRSSSHDSSDDTAPAGPLGLTKEQLDGTARYIYLGQHDAICNTGQFRIDLKVVGSDPSLARYDDGLTEELKSFFEQMSTDGRSFLSDVNSISAQDARALSSYLAAIQKEMQETKTDSNVQIQTTQNTTSEAKGNSLPSILLGGPEESQKSTADEFNNKYGVTLVRVGRTPQYTVSNVQCFRSKTATSCRDAIGVLNVAFSGESRDLVLNSGLLPETFTSKAVSETFTRMAATQSEQKVAEQHRRELGERRANLKKLKDENSNLQRRNTDLKDAVGSLSGVRPAATTPFSPGSDDEGRLEVAELDARIKALTDLNQSLDRQNSGLETERINLVNLKRARDYLGQFPPKEQFDTPGIMAAAHGTRYSYLVNDCHLDSGKATQLVNENMNGDSVKPIIQPPPPVPTAPRTEPFRPPRPGDWMAK